jgi:tricorn protease
MSLLRLDPRSPEPVTVASDVGPFAVSPDRRKLLLLDGDTWHVRPLPQGTGGTSFSLSDVRLTIDPQQEWRQIYHDAWRAMRDLFYDPAHHGQDVDAVEKRYARYLPGITRRTDLTALLYLALGNVSVSHIAFDGGDNGVAPPAIPTAGLLGADLEVDGDRFRFTRVYSGSPFALESPEAIARGPLEGVDPPVKPGDFLLRVDDTEVTTERDLHSYLVGTAGRATRITIAESRDGRRARTLTIQPSKSDAALREAAWIDANRALVDARSQGSIGYVYLPDFQERGMAAFLRQWASTSNQDGVVIDQRFNPGGWAADFILDLVSHRPLSSYMFRDSRDLPFPVIGNRGPRALLVNERNGSAAETFPWLFRRSGSGTIVGRRTAGAGVGHLYRLSFTDGGGVSLPLRAFFNPDGQWDIENHGVVPDVEVEPDPAAALHGRDAQLEAAVDAVLARRREHPSPVPSHPKPMVFPAQPKNGTTR